ncbi:MAG: glyoxalase [Patescibacteria group bacterium]
MKNTFINLPIRNVADTDAFFAALGMPKNDQFSSADTTNARINENTFVMLLEDKRFATFVDGNPIPVNNNLTIAIQFDSKSEVDSFCEKAIAAGATDTTKPSPESAAFMYGKAIRDINGHIWEPFAFIGEMPQA